MKRTIILGALFSLSVHAQAPRDSVPIDSAEWPSNYRLHVEFSAATKATMQLSPEVALPLAAAKSHDIAIEHPASGSALLRVWSDGKLVRGPEEIKGLQSPKQAATKDYPDAKVDLGADFTAAVTFTAAGAGTLFSQSAPKGTWSADAKALFIRDGKLVYDIGWLGEMSGGAAVNDGKTHTAVLSCQKGHARLWIDGTMSVEKGQFTKPKVAGHILKVGRAAKGFAGDLEKGTIGRLKIWSRALPDDEIALLFKSDGKGANTPDFTHAADGATSHPSIKPEGGATIKAAWVQPLERGDHSAIVQTWNQQTLEEGKNIYNANCVICHGTKDKEGSLPTALRFAQGQFKNGSDPYSMFTTLTKGYGQMIPQPQYTTAQKYAVIHYIRETFLAPHNPGQLVKVTPEYLANLPKGLAKAEAEVEDKSLPQYQRMDLGPALFWTYQIAPGNIAQKGIAIRLDDGPGGVSKGRAWMVYDHDTMRMAAATTGKFVDWKGIAFDGSHGTHTSLTGEPHFINPVGPGWASPEGSWEDSRPLGRDQKPYGPLPRNWAHYEGLYTQGEKMVIAATVGGTLVLESPDWIDFANTPVFIRTFNVAASAKPLLLRVAPDSLNVILRGDGKLAKDGGFWVASIPGNAKTRVFISKTDGKTLESISQSHATPLSLEKFTKGGPPRWAQEVGTTSVAGDKGGPFIADTFPLPLDNPWQSWLRPGGFDFTPDGKGAIVAMWNGDVWRVDGITEPAPAPLRWRRIAAGLFQPLGVKFRGEELFISCRNQLARLKDLNGDGEIDYIDSFNNDHQVTEHFHEFAMGLQCDAAGNFYYAKSARHALDCVVPHHGTLLRVSADGKTTEILATGFRAANGVCLNDDGTFFVTDQEGHWTPKNRINRVKPGGFYGNMFGYSNVTDSSDSAMQQPMVWITNNKDRSPAELLWVPKNAWGTLGGSLLNISYGTGRAFIVPNEEIGGQWQGAVCELPMPAFKTGIMRGRFAADGSLYTSGMFAWAGNASDPGGFHRIIRSKSPAYLPKEIHALKGALKLVFSEPVDPASVQTGAFTCTMWSLKRSANYGSNHVQEHVIPVTAAKIEKDARTMTLTIPQLAPTQCYELKVNLKAPDGTAIERSILGTIHQLGED